MTAQAIDTPSVSASEDALLLDFDGVLVALAPRPDAVRPAARLLPLLRRLHRDFGGAVAIVSGRTIADLERFLPGYPGTLVGSHGAERRGPEGAPPPETGASDDTGDAAVLAALHDDLRRAADEKGLLAEIKTRGGALHFRETPHREADARRAAETLAACHPGFVVQPAKMAYELKPEGAAKDAAVAGLMAAPPFAGRRPVYLGDDATDEAALDWVQARGGLGVKVGDGESVARHRLSGPEAVLDWLERALKEQDHG